MYGSFLCVKNCLVTVYFSLRDNKIMIIKFYREYNTVVHDMDCL